jgi:hypothetical protein
MIITMAIDEKPLGDFGASAAGLRPVSTHNPLIWVLLPSKHQ